MPGNSNFFLTLYGTHANYECAIRVIQLGTTKRAKQLDIFIDQGGSKKDALEAKTFSHPTNFYFNDRTIPYRSLRQVRTFLAAFCVSHASRG